MSRLRFRSGQVHLVKVPVDPAIKIEAGDMVWCDGKVARPASSVEVGDTMTGSLMVFATQFLGIAHQSSEVGDDIPISVDISPLSVYEMDVVPGTFGIGDCLCPLTGQQLSNQTLQTVIGEPAVKRSMAIARAVEVCLQESSTLRVSFASAFSTASANVNARMAG